MTDKLRQALEMALRYIERHPGKGHSDWGKTMLVIRQALAEPDTGTDRGAWSDVPDATKWVDELRGDEPIAKVCHDLPQHIGWNPKLTHLPDEGMPLYASPPVTGKEPVAWMVEPKPYDADIPVKYMVKQPERITQFFDNPEDAMVLMGAARDEVIPLYAVPPSKMSLTNALFQAQNAAIDLAKQVEKLSIRDAKPDLLKQTCCECGKSDGYALYCGECWSKATDH